jgi:hypothetical protein
MGDDTYYTVLGIAETATQSEIKAAYRILIKQVHPDTLAALSPYLRRIAEDKAKEMTEAYSVLSNATKRRQYNQLIAEHRQQSGPHTSPPTPPVRTGAVGAQAKRGGYDWKPLRHWVGRHPLIACSLGAIAILGVIGILPSSDSTTPSQGKARVVTTETAKQAIPPPPAGITLDGGNSKRGGAVTSSPAITGTYFGTVHNKTVSLSSSFEVLFEQKAGGILEGCADVKPPLYGSGALHGSIRGSHVDFIVSDIRFQGDIRSREITGSYVVSRSDGQQLGDFHLARKMGTYPEYHCTGGTLTETLTDKKQTNPIAPHVASKPDTEEADLAACIKSGTCKVVNTETLPSASPQNHPKPVAEYAVVNTDYAAIEKRCAFLPSDNYGRCGYQPTTVARPRKGDRLRLLSPKTRAENGEDIYEVRTEQGWQGWIDSKFVVMEQ